MKESCCANGLRIVPEINKLDEVQSYIDSVTAPTGISLKQKSRISVSVDEMFSNIAKYSGASEVCISCSAENGKITITFSDDGIPFDPMKKEAPDIKAHINDRKPGGLGISIVKKFMDAMEYSYRDGRNVLSLISEYKDK